MGKGCHRDPGLNALRKKSVLLASYLISRIIDGFYSFTGNKLKSITTRIDCLASQDWHLQWLADARSIPSYSYKAFDKVNILKIRVQ